MGNNNTCCCVWIPIGNGDAAFGVDIAADGSIDKRSVGFLAKALEGYELKGESHPEFRLLLLYGVAFRIDADLTAARSMAFEPSESSLNRTLVDLLAGGIVTRKRRSVLSHIYTNVCPKDLPRASVYVRCVLRECGVTRGVWGGKVADIDHDNAICAAIEESWATAIAVRIEASVDGAPVDGSPLRLDLGVLTTQPLGPLASLSVSLPPETQFAVAIVFCVGAEEAVGPVYLFQNMPSLLPLLMKVHRLAAGGARGLLRRRRVPVLSDVYQTSVATNACGAHVPLIRDTAREIVALLGGVLTEFRAELETANETPKKT